MAGESTDSVTLRAKPVTAPRPDFAYFSKVLRRQALFGIVVGVIILAGGAVLVLQAKDVYKSTVIAVFDKRDRLGVDRLDAVEMSSPEAVEYGFENRMVSADFLSELQKRVFPDAEVRPSLINRLLNRRPVETAEQHRARMVAYFDKRLVPRVNPGTGVLQLDVMLDGSPEKSVELASTAMEMFIASEIRGAATRLGAKIELLTKAVDESRARQKRAARHLSVDGKRALSSSDLLAAKQREGDLAGRLQVQERVSTELEQDQARRRSSLESELELLQARLTPDHPDIAAKERELAIFTDEAQRAADEAKRRLPDLRHELWQIRYAMDTSAAATTAALASMTAEERLEAAHISELATKVNDLTLEKAGLDRQVTDDRLRTRLKVSKPASYEMKPFERKRLQALLGSVALALLWAFLLMVVREAACPLARDSWRVARTLNTKILAQLSARSLSTLVDISPKFANELRSGLSPKGDRNLLETRTLLGYRHIEMVIGRVRKGSVLFFAASGSMDRTKKFFSNLVNIMATDTGYRILVIDCASNDHVTNRAGKGATKDGKGRNDYDWVDAALGHCEWQPLVTRANETSSSFDVLKLTKPLTDGRIGPLTKTRATSLFSQLTTVYDIVLIRSLPETHFIENAALAALCTDTIVCVDARQSTYAELERTLSHLDGPSMRGLIMVGT